MLSEEKSTETAIQEFIKHIAEATKKLLSPCL
jgi:hypothetical protein